MYFTQDAADHFDADLAPAAKRAAIILRPRANVQSVDLAGVYLQRTDADTWEVFAERTADAELLDELDPGGFRTAVEVFDYLDGLNLPETPTGDVDAPEVA